MGEILVGVCGWNDKALVESAQFYPRDINTVEQRLQYYSTRFRLVENDASYYSLPTERQSQLWCQRTDRHFVMNYKAFATFTGHYIDAGRLPREVRDLVPANLRYKRNLYARDLPDEVLAQLWLGFRHALMPLHEQGKLGVVLFQFPEWFPCTRQNKDYIISCQAQLPEFRLGIEFRSGTWLSERNRADSLAFLRANNVALAIVDQPPGLPNPLPQVYEATSDIAIVRFHGRNLSTWNKKEAVAAERFKYFYTNEDLTEWVPRLHELARETRQVQALMHNNFSDYSVRNAATLAKLLETEPVS